MKNSASITRVFLGLVLAILLPAGTASAQAFASGPDASYVPSKNAGEVDGEVLSIDYQRGVLSVATKSRGKLDVVVLPSTNIVDKSNNYATIAELKRGTHVKLFLSKRGDTLNAQIIKIE